MESYEKVKEIIKRYENTEGALIQILHEIQESYSYIPQKAQEMISESLRIPLSEIYGVITFYARFTLKPTGKYRVCSCMGTACYVKGAETVLRAVKEHLGIESGDTTSDGLFSLAEAYCIGACGLAPVMTVNEDVYAKITPDKVAGILESYKSKEAKI